jgi:cytochrome c
VGEKVFLKCMAGHQVGRNAVGPELNGLVGRHAGMASCYRDSDAAKTPGTTGDEVSLGVYMKD